MPPPPVRLPPPPPVPTELTFSSSTANSTTYTTQPVTGTYTPQPVPGVKDEPVDALPPPVPVEPPLAGENVMNMVFVGAECAPWSKTGGLGDVMGALPKAMARRGHRVMVVVPRYEIYNDAWDTDVRVRYRVLGQEFEVGYFHAYVDKVDFVFVDHGCYHGRSGSKIYEGSRMDTTFRNALLCKAALEAVWHVPCGGITYGDNNTCFIANDWHTAILPVYLQVRVQQHT